MGEGEDLYHLKKIQSRNRMVVDFQETNFLPHNSDNVVGIIIITMKRLASKLGQLPMKHNLLFALIFAEWVWSHYYYISNIGLDLIQAAQNT